jgi:hypothetical protein
MSSARTGEFSAMTLKNAKVHADIGTTGPCRMRKTEQQRRLTATGLNVTRIRPAACAPSRNGLPRAAESQQQHGIRVRDAGVTGKLGVATGPDTAAASCITLP